MPKNIFDLPSEVRNDIYAQLLVLEYPISISEFQFHQSLELTTGLLLANRAIRQETTSMLYAQNCFDFTPCGKVHAVHFIENIGRVNANHIREIRLDIGGYSAFEDIPFDLFREQCNHLSKVTIQWTIPPEWPDETEVAKENMDLIAAVNTRLRAMPSLEEIIVEVCDDLTDELKRHMEDQGWSIRYFAREEDRYAGLSFDDSVYYGRDDDDSYSD